MLHNESVMDGREDVAGSVTAGSDVQFSDMQLARRYALSDEMAPGALCRIIRGDDLMLRRPVVVKAVPPEQAEVYMAALRATSALTHPAAVALYDVVREGDWLFLVQEAVAGQSLARYLRQGVPGERAVNLALQLAQALAYTHHRDMIHGDLTPSAVLVDRQAVARVNNFGLPPDLDYFLAEGGSDIQALVAEGTPYSDVLAVGLLLRQLLSSAELAGSEPGGRQLRPEVSTELARLVTRCTSPVGDDTLTDAASLVIALEETMNLLAAARQAHSSDTPAALRAVRESTARQELWAGEQTVAETQVPQYILERDSHEVGSRVTRITDPGHSDGATRPSDESDLAMPPRLRLPTRPSLDEVYYTDSARAMPGARGAYPDAEHPHGALLTVVLAVGALLFIIFFLLGYLGPLLLGGR
jgi:hypothetical protein